MTVKLNEKTLTLYGTCDKCGGKLYDITVETGEAVCEKCEQIEVFDPAPFIEWPETDK